MLWCAASNKGTEHHLEFIFSCQIISAKGKEIQENKLQPPAPMISDTSVPPCKPGTTLYLPWLCKPSTPRGCTRERFLSGSLLPGWWPALKGSCVCSCVTIAQPTVVFVLNHPCTCPSSTQLHWLLSKFLLGWTDQFKARQVGMCPYIKP